jgi:hypothetical protein
MHLLITKFPIDYQGAWTSLRKPISSTDKTRRDYFLGTGNHQKKSSVQSKRQGLYKSIYFMSQLPDSEYENQSSLEGEEEVDYNTRASKRPRQTAQPQMQMPMAQQRQQQMAQQMAQQQQQSAYPMAVQSMHAQAPPRPAVSAPRRTGGLARFQPENDEYDLEDDDDKPRSPMETKQFLLHLLSTELLLNTRLHGDFTCVHSEFESWNPSLPHSTINAVLSFFGLSEKWLRFFRNFLAAPLKFVEDGVSAETKVRKRGAPGAHSLSVICGESILFCLDYAVNQRTHGTQLYRMHDDFWIWSSAHDTVVKGWEAVTEFTKVMGVSLNATKTGTVRITGNTKVPGADQKVPSTINPVLPEGDIRWGFLHLDPETGRFIIDQVRLSKQFFFQSGFLMSCETFAT